MEGALGANFGEVRIHTDAESDVLNRGVSAVAFTTGSDIFFSQGSFEPNTAAGRQLLAHELTHVVQQGGMSGSGPLTVGPAGDSHEQEADAAASAVASQVEGSAGPVPLASVPAATAAARRVIRRKAVADLPPLYTPVPPDSDPKFTQAMGTVAHAATEAKHHHPVQEMTKVAQDASPTPPNDTTAKAQTKQAQSMSAAQPTKPDKNAFKEMLRQKLVAIAPKTDDDLKKFKSSGKAAQMQGELKQGVAGQREHAQGPITTATNASPPSVAARTTGAAPAAPGQANLPQVQVANVVPPPAPDPGPAMAAQAHEADQSMVDAKLTTQQLQKANDPRFSAVVTARDQVHSAAATMPKQFNAQQQAILNTTHAGAHDAVTKAHTQMHQAHAHAHAGAHAEQEKVMSRDAQERQKVAADIESRFAAIKTKVENKLKAMGDEVDKMFTQGEEASRGTFESEVDRRTTEYWLEHPIDAAIGAVFGGDSEKARIYKEESANHMTRVMNVIDRIADFVEQQLKEAKELITQGQAEIEKHVAELDPKLRQSAQEAEKALGSRFEELQHSIDAKREELANHLVDLYKQAQQKIDDRVKELKESDKGIIDGFVEKLEAVKKAIDEFKKRLQGVVTDGEATLDLIIGDPIAFLGHLLDALKAGFMGFVGNIATHLEKGFISWLTGGIASMGITLPETWDLKGIISLALQVLDLTWEKIKGKIHAKIEKLIGPKAMRVLDKVVEYAQAAWNGGMAGLIEKAKEDLGNLKDMIFGAIKSYLTETIVKIAIQKLVALSNPVGEIIEAVMDIYKVVMFFIEKANQIMSLVETIVKSVSNIAHGAIGQAAQWIENAMASTIPIIIGFLADLLGIGDLPDKIREVHREGARLHRQGHRQSDRLGV